MLPIFQLFQGKHFQTAFISIDLHTYLPFLILNNGFFFFSMLMFKYFLYLLHIPFLCKIIIATACNCSLIMACILFNDPFTKWNYMSS